MMHCYFDTGSLKNQHFQNTGLIFWEGGSGSQTRVFSMYAFDNVDISGQPHANRWYQLVIGSSASCYEFVIGSHSVAGEEASDTTADSRPGVEVTAAIQLASAALRIR